MSDGPCVRCGAYGGFGCYECIPPDAIDRRIAAKIAELEKERDGWRTEIATLDYAMHAAEARADADAALLREAEEAAKTIRRQMDYPQSYNRIIDETVCALLARLEAREVSQ
jgi:hypothetical protein